MNRIKDNRYLWIYGKHACLSALKNPNRVCIELLITHKFIDKNDPVIKLAKNRKIGIRDVEIAKIDSLVGSKAIHQGMLLKVLPLFGRNASSLIRIEDIVAQTETAPTSTILVLDEVTDVHNVGAVLRTAACFNVDAVVLTEHNSPSESCGMAKASSGAIDIVPVVCIGNLVKTLEYLKQKNYWCYGFDASGGICLHQVEFSERRVVILGAEGKGMRHLTKKHCDHLVKIPMSEKMESLNVSNAAAIAMYSVFLGDKSS
ncbi:Putative TrmH family tRNA/rRNA methyltransferase [Anaplasma phagocytophilum]|uniref:TrmH family tRNA/rRNA methyltransferase n=1 Tax=Anaplasma phagocytophilum TaxID=948 RepID=A0AA45ZI16_ANAPH|nr:23S rRNA (guanosine(2251)-2'-O)-methyltransferase RlmB [Anaplasma phagocytophilum]SBO14741.1 Putative TrmH family tRNA/rRNA methyltransferase [Anaplasma phagocytophilum]